MQVGFSGSQDGMSDPQAIVVRGILDRTDIDGVHSGDCIGADKQFHDIAKSLHHWSIGHPPHNHNKRAFCRFDEERRPQDYLVRNKIIVDESDEMIFTPKGFKEELRSGTWSTIRYNEKAGKPKAIVWPDGELTREGIEYGGPSGL